MVSFVALYRGDRLQTAKLVAVTADPEIISRVAEQLLSEPPEHPEDPILGGLHERRARALELMSEGP